MKILGLETSCDETAAAVVEIDSASGAGRALSDVVHTQADVHARFGGVVPELTSELQSPNNLVCRLLLVG